MDCASISTGLAQAMTDTRKAGWDMRRLGHEARHSTVSGREYGGLRWGGAVDVAARSMRAATGWKGRRGDLSEANGAPASGR